MGDDRTALSLAESSQWGMLYQMITKHPERAEECDDFGMMPLHWACTVQGVQPRVIKKLVDAHPLAVMLKNKGGLIPLHIAIKAKVPLEVLHTLVTANNEAVCEETPSGETPAELGEEYGLSREAVAFLSDMEDELRRSGRMPPRPARFRPLSRHASMRGFGNEPLSNPRSSDYDFKRQDVSSLRAAKGGFGSLKKSGASIPHALPPRWNLDRKCNICQIKFTYFKNRHHCRNCGVSVCSTHSSKRLPLQHIGLDAPQRVCIMCYDDLRENGKPPSAVENLYTKKTKPRAPVRDLTNGHRSSLTHSQAATVLASSVSSQRSGYAFDGSKFHDSDVEDENIPPEVPRSRPRAQTGMEGADRIAVMKDQVKELETHVRELRGQKERIKQAIDDGNHKAQHALKEKHNQEVAVVDVRGESIIDVSRVTLDTELEKRVLGVDAAVDDLVVSAEELDMPDDATLDVAATCHYLGLAYLEKGEYANAVTELRKSVSLYRRDSDVWYTLARALLQVDELFEAELAVQRALGLHPNNYGAMSLLGKILHARGEHDRSIEAFQQALALMTTESDSGDEEDVGSMTVGW